VEEPRCWQAVSFKTAAPSPLIHARAMPIKRLTALELEFAAIERLTKELRRRLDTVAETVRIAAEELARRKRHR
jgi:hypothetical protein